jgi:hypothetical protein
LKATKNRSTSATRGASLASTVTTEIDTVVGPAEGAVPEEHAAITNPIENHRRTTVQV